MKQWISYSTTFISDPKQFKNDIDLYLNPFIQNLKLLWDEGVSVFDAYEKTRLHITCHDICTL